jgi:hypothetical protein
MKVSEEFNGNLHLTHQITQNHLQSEIINNSEEIFLMVAGSAVQKFELRCTPNNYLLPLI